jgi:DNA repair exonuclease SbcCD ATPase subunit
MIGIVLLASGQKLPGLVAAVVGLLVGIGAFVAPRAGRTEPQQQPTASDDVGPPPPPPIPPRLEEVPAPVPPDPNPRLTDLQVAIRTQDQAVRTHAERINSAKETLAANGLDADPAVLRQLARAIDDAEAARERHRAHSEQATSFRSARDSLAMTLAGALGTGISADVTEETVRELNDAFASYAAACRERANLAIQADRRTDLLAALEQRKQTETQHTAAVTERESQAAALISFVTDLGQTPGSAASAAELLRQWLNGQGQARRDQNHRDQLAVRLDQTLGGRDMAQIRTDLDTLVTNAGPDPGELPDDIENFKASAYRRNNALVESLGQLGGRQQELGSTLGSVAATVEREAEAERQVMRIQLLASCIDAATAQLRIAKERANASIAPAIQARVRPWLPKVTNGRYLDVEVDPSDLKMKVTEASGAIRDAHLLSQGTTEQLFLLLRVALAQTLSGQNETAPLLLDDVTAQSDQRRTTAILEMLHLLSAERQVVLFTQEDEVADWARANLQPERDQFLSLPAPQ